jgi:hypothetical protein
MGVRIGQSNGIFDRESGEALYGRGVWQSGFA